MNDLMKQFAGAAYNMKAAHDNNDNTASFHASCCANMLMAIYDSTGSCPIISSIGENTVEIWCDEVTYTFDVDEL